jgi:chemotaxis protein CheX
MTTEVQPELTRTELVDAIKTATQQVFSTMLNLQVEAGEEFVEKQEPAPTSGVVSIVGLAGTWIGSGSLSCSAALASKIASHLLLVDYDAVNEDVLDAVAEVTNMIIGNVKTELENRLGAIGLSTPTVIYGRNFQTRGARNQEWTVVPFTLGENRMCIQMYVAPNPDAAQQGVRPGFPIPHLLNL